MTCTRSTYAGLKRLFSFATLSVLILTAGARAQLSNDLDEDGLDDTLEQTLIDRHRPWLLYDSEESFWPSTLTWFVQRSNLDFCSEAHVVYTHEQLMANPRLAVSAVTSDPGCNAGQPQHSSFLATPQGTAYALDLLNSARGGMGPLPVGMYAHVVRVTGPIDRSCGRVVPAGTTAILVQYWQFFPMNESTFCQDHEGDWLRLDVYVASAAPHALMAIVYDPHGSAVRDRCLPLDAPLPSDGVPRCYLEEDAHEWWPSPQSGGTFERCEDGNGLGANIRAANVLNLGERYAPLVRWDQDPGTERLLALFFNGQWGQEGTNPRGPTARGEVHFPSPLAATAKYASPSSPAQWDLSGFTAADFARGSRYFPVRRVADAISSVAPGGVVLLHAGSYPEAGITIDTPMTLQSLDGTATIGQ